MLMDMRNTCKDVDSNEVKHDLRKPTKSTGSTQERRAWLAVWPRLFIIMIHHIPLLSRIFPGLDMDISDTQHDLPLPPPLRS